MKGSRYAPMKFHIEYKLFNQNKWLVTMLNSAVQIKFICMQVEVFRMIKLFEQPHEIMNLS